MRCGCRTNAARWHAFVEHQAPSVRTGISHWGSAEVAAPEPGLRGPPAPLRNSLPPAGCGVMAASGVVMKLADSRGSVTHTSQITTKTQTADAQRPDRGASASLLLAAACGALPPGFPRRLRSVPCTPHRAWDLTCGSSGACSEGRNRESRYFTGSGLGKPGEAGRRIGPCGHLSRESCRTATSSCCGASRQRRTGTAAAYHAAQTNLEMAQLRVNAWVGWARPCFGTPSYEAGPERPNRRIPQMIVLRSGMEPGLAADWSPGHASTSLRPDGVIAPRHVGSTSSSRLATAF